MSTKRQLIWFTSYSCKKSKRSRRHLKQTSKDLHQCHSLTLSGLVSLSGLTVWSCVSTKLKILSKIFTLFQKIKTKKMPLKNIPSSEINLIQQSTTPISAAGKMTSLIWTPLRLTPSLKFQFSLDPSLRRKNFQSKLPKILSSQDLKRVVFLKVTLIANCTKCWSSANTGKLSKLLVS